MAKKNLSLAAMEKIMKKVGSERVSEEAKVALRDVLEDIAEEISSDAMKLAQHAGRKTIKADDVKLASK